MDLPKAWSLDHREIGLGGKRSFRPTIMGTNGMVSSGHYLSSLAGVQVLQEGGNAIDAGVAAVVAGSVLQSNFVDFAGCASIHIYRADLDQSFAIAGIGRWPATASVQYFRDHHGGQIPEGVANGVVPAAPDAYLTAIERFGTWTFGRAVQRAIELARDGFPMYPFRYYQQLEMAERIRHAPSTREVMWPDGRQPEIGEIFRQRDLGRTLQIMADAEAGVRGRSRQDGIQAARDVFYRGEIADRVDAFYRENGGLLRKSDLADYRVTVDPPRVGSWNGYEVRTVQFWSKGPLLIQLLNMLEGDDLRAIGHNSPEYVHLLTEALKLAFADRHAYFGDPLMTDVPAEGLLSKEYARERRKLIDPNRAWPEMPPAGDPWNGRGRRDEPAAAVGATGGQARSAVDTSNLAVMDRWGNAFSVTFSDSFMHAPITPGTGFTSSTRGVQAWVDENHPNRVEAGRRPVITGNPAMFFKDGKLRLVVGSPGSDVQLQAMLQVSLNILQFGMEPQEAVEAPRFATYSHPESFSPHPYHPGVLRVEARLPEATFARLEALGHKVQPWQAWQWQAGGICAITSEPATGLLCGGTDTRRENYAIGW